MMWVWFVRCEGVVCDVCGAEGAGCDNELSLQMSFSTTTCS